MKSALPLEDVGSPTQGSVIPEGVLNFHFGIGVRPEGSQMGLKEWVGTKNRGLKN